MKQKWKEIFVFIAGATPQVITETIYALGTQKQPVFPDELYIITTSEGRRRVEETLVLGGKLKALGREYGFTVPELTETSFIIPSGLKDIPLSDIRNEDDNERMGDLITSLIREKSADPTSRLHCSIAGGRKTMSFYLGAALQMLAREQDRLYHVLVSPEFESHPDFFYKPKKNTVIEARGKKLNTKDAVITLAELPFIRLRDKVVQESRGYRELIRKGQKSIDTALVRPLLKIGLSEGSIMVGATPIPLSMLHFSIYCMYVKRKTEHCTRMDSRKCAECTECFPALKDMDPKELLEEVMATYTPLARSRAMDYKAKHPDGIVDQEIRQAISKIKRAFNENLKDPALAEYYAITSLQRSYGSTRHGLRVEREMIKVVEG